MSRVVAKTVAIFPAVLTYGGVDYDCSIEADSLTAALEDGGFDPERTLTILVPNSEAMTAYRGRSLTIKTTQTDALETLVFKIRGIVAHPNLPATVLTVNCTP